MQIVMEYCNAGSVADIMGICDIRLDEEQISHVCASVLLGFEYLHASRHIHRVRTYLLWRALLPSRKVVCQCPRVCSGVPVEAPQPHCVQWCAS